MRGPAARGYEVADALRSAYDVHPELATHATIVLVLGIGQPAEALVRFAGDVDETVKRIAAAGRASQALVRAPARAAATRWSSRRATRSSARPSVVAVDDAVGRISCESIAGYPPGIPALLPGERITAEAVAYLRELVARARACTARRTPRWPRSTSCAGS